MSDTTNYFKNHYQISGKGEPVLFIHGLGSSSRDWQFQTSFFEKEYQVITVDVRGHGQSDRSSVAFSIELFAADIIALLAELKITKIHLVGLSMGGMIAFEMALKHPSLIKSMVIVNSGPGYLNMNLKLRFKFLLRLLSLHFLSMEKVAAAVASGLFPSSDQQHLRNLFIERFIENDKKSYIKSLQALAKWNIVAKLDQIQCPTLILAADNDYTSVESKRDYTAKLKQGQLQVIANSHHALPVEKPDEFNRSVQQFLQSLNPD